MPKPRLPHSAQLILDMLDRGELRRQDIGLSFSKRPMSPQTAAMICGRLIKPLVRFGYVSEVRCNDGRHRGYQLTDAGREVLAEIERGEGSA